MDDNLYDEFGNYIGPDLGDSSEDDSESEEEEEEGEDEEGEEQGVGEVRTEGTREFLSHGSVGISVLSHVGLKGEQNSWQQGRHGHPNLWSRLPVSCSRLARN